MEPARGDPGAPREEDEPGRGLGELLGKGVDEETEPVRMWPEPSRAESGSLLSSVRSVSEREGGAGLARPASPLAEPSPETWAASGAGTGDEVRGGGTEDVLPG